MIAPRSTAPAFTTAREHHTNASGDTSVSTQYLSKVRGWTSRLAALALAGCGGSGSSGYDTGALAKEITTRLDQHPRFAVRSVSCPQQARKAKGVVIHCSATLRDGEVDQMRATQLDDSGTIHLVLITIIDGDGASA